MDMNDDILNMPKGWIVQYEDGTIITEFDREGNETNWKKIPKKSIKSVSLKWYNKFWTITGKDNYLQKKRGWIIPVAGIDQHPNIEYRYVGYWEGNDKVYYRVDEVTGQMKMVVENIAGEEKVLL